MSDAKPTRRDLADRISAFVDDGLTATQIGQELGMSRQRVMRIAAQYRVRLQPRGGKRRIGAHFSGKDYEIMRALADKANVSVGTMLVRIARVVVEDGAGAAARRLGSAARPKRSYVRRTALERA